MIRTAFILLWVGLATSVFGVIAIVVSFFTRTGNPVHIVARIWAQINFNGQPCQSQHQGAI